MTIKDECCQSVQTCEEGLLLLFVQLVDWLEGSHTVVVVAVVTIVKCNSDSCNHHDCMGTVVNKLNKHVALYSLLIS